MAGARKKHVSVKFSGDDDVINHIVKVDDGRFGTEVRPVRSRKSRTGSTAKQKKPKSDDPGSSEDDVSTPLFAPLQDEDINMYGSDLFHFKTTKKSDQMAQKAIQARTPNHKKNAPVPQVTPKSSKKTSVKQVKVIGNEPKTPTRNGQNKRGLSVKRIEATTPFRLRKRNQLSDGESSDESVGSSDEDEEGDNDSDNSSRTKQPPPSSAKVPPTPTSTRKPGRPRRAPEMEIMPSMVEGYFEVHSGGVGPTSDRTLAKLGTPKMDQSKLSQMLSSVLISHQTECKSLVEQHQELFNQWMFHMCNGFNLLLYGLGSKRSLMEEFRETVLTDFTHLVVNGYFPSLTIKQVLNSITEDILGHSGNFRNPLDQLDFIKEQYSVGDYQDVYIIIHNIDGAMLRGDKTQNVISLLSQIRGFHVVASIDHINSPLIWDKMKCSRFNWLWYDVTTYIPYKEETSYENSLLVQQSGALALSSLTHVLRSLTLNARRIFLLLAHYQLENKADNPSYIGMSFRDMYQRCRENFLVNSDLTLRTQLIEFRDHKMITSKQGHDGMEYLVIPIEMATLSEFLETQEELLTQD